MAKKNGTLQGVAEKWRQGTQHYLDSYADTARQIHEEARNMPHDNLDDSAKIVEMAVRKTREHAEQYHQGE